MTTIAFTMMHLLAQTTAPTSGGAAAEPKFFQNPLFLFALIFIVFLFFQMNSKRKQDKKRTESLNAMKRGDRVQTIGGILGTVVEVRDNEIVVKVDESNNTKIKFTRSAVSRVLGDDDKAEK